MKDVAAGRRRHHRYDVEDVHGSLRLAKDATILNLSVDGMALETSSWLSVGGSYAVKLSHGPEVLALTGKVVWCSLVRTVRNDREETLPIYRAGIEFDDVLSEKARQLRSVIERNAIARLESTRLFGRFRMRHGESLAVNFEQEFKVRRISLSGMLIEADLMPELDSRFDLEIRSGERPIEAGVRVAYVQAIEDGGSAEIGVEFITLGEDDKATLETLLSREGRAATEEI